MLIDEGCTLSLLIGDTRVNLTNNSFRILPSDDLIEGIRDLAGFNAIQIGYGQ